jgi:oxalate decarboxylase/phosphoglucose isomerase-like protein (cupin superfamily)
MINLQDSSGLPLLLNVHDNSLQPAGDIYFTNLERIKLYNLRPVLLNKTLRYPTDVYNEYCDICLTEHKNIFIRSKLHYSIIVLPSGLLGIEYNKTHIFAPDSDKSIVTTIIEILYGKGSIIIQRIKSKKEMDFDTEVSFAAISKVQKGNLVAIPQNYMYTFVNASNNPLIIARLYEDDGKIDYRSLRKEHGMSYYLIRKNARQEVVRNPNYKDVPNLEKLSSQTYIKKCKITLHKPLYSQFLCNTTKFCKLLI